MLSLRRDEVAALLVLLQRIVEILFADALDVEATHQLVVDLVVIVVAPTIGGRAHEQLVPLI